jgi:hypothetical protein
MSGTGNVTGVPSKRTIEWVDSKQRFMARVSPDQDDVSFVRLELRAPGRAKRGVTEDEDNLFLEMQEVLCLRPHHPSKAMLPLNPGLCEVFVHVDNFWSANESGGNSGRSIRNGTVYVSGEVEDLRRLRGEEEVDQRFTDRIQRKRGGVCAVRGLEHVLENGTRDGLRLYRMGRADLATRPAFPGSRWLCIDYSRTHPFHCNYIPNCSFRRGKLAAYTNPHCNKPGRLYIRRDHCNVQDFNDVVIVQSEREDSLVETPNGTSVLGFLTREFAACLAPALDAGVIEVSGTGTYSKTDLRSFRVWFKFDALVSTDEVGGVDMDSIQGDLDVMPWWSESKGSGIVDPDAEN